MCTKNTGELELVVPQCGDVGVGVGGGSSELMLMLAFNTHSLTRMHAVAQVRGVATGLQ